MHTASCPNARRTALEVRKRAGTACAGALLSTAALGTTYGDLAPGAISVAETTGVRAEACRDHLFDPAWFKAALPQGYRLITASALAADDAAVAALAPKGSPYHSYAAASLCFMSVDAWIIDGKLANADPVPMAFWWARVERTAPPDPRMKGKIEWLQLASWYPTIGLDRAATLATDPMARFVALSVEEAEAGHWKMRMQLADERVEADVRASGPRQRRKGPQPGSMTVPFSGAQSAFFAVFTYFGHNHRRATGTWSATGSGVFSKALAIPGEARAFGTIFQDGWQAKSALYRNPVTSQ